MPITRCTACKSDDVYDGTLLAQGGVVLGRKKPKFSWSFVRVRCAACLTCGTVFPYIASEDCDKVRVWKGEEAGGIGNYMDGTQPQEARGNLVGVMIVLAIIAILAAIVIPYFLQAGGQVK